MNKDSNPDPRKILRPFDEEREGRSQSSEADHPEHHDHNITGALSNFWEELKRRKVMRVALTYTFVGWLVIQVANATFSEFGIPLWAYRFVVLMVVLGFPISLVLAWAFELTPDGLKTTKVARQEMDYTKNPFRVSKIRNWLAYAVGALFPTLIFGSLAVFFYFQNRPAYLSQTIPHVVPAVTQESPKKSIAVLPLENMSPEADNAFFANGIQEDILTNLSKVRDFHVISRSSTLQYRNPDRNLKQIGDELGVEYIVEGSVRRVENKVRVTVQLIETQDDIHLWAENYERDLDNVFGVQSEITREIAAQLKAILSPEEIAQIEHRPTENKEAYRFYKERQLIERAPDNMEQKIELLEKAVAADPKFGEAWSLLAMERVFKWYNEKNRNDPGLLASAYEAFEQAKRWGQGLADLEFAKSTFAYNVDMDVERSIDHLLEALAIDPSYHSAQWLLVARYHNIGNLAEAQHHGETLLRMDPLFSYANRWLYRTYQSRRETDKALSLVCDNLGRTNMEPFWQKALADTQYILIGDRSYFLEDLERITGHPDSHLVPAMRHLIARDYDLLLDLLPSMDPEKGIPLILDDIFRFNNFNLGAPSLLAALIKFQKGGSQDWLEENNKAKTYLEYAMARDSFSGPDPLSKLAICNALANDREGLADTIAKVRDLTAMKVWKYRYQLSCEMHIAIAYIVLGDHDKAIETLEAASKMDGPIFLNRELDLWFIFDGLRGDPRFDALLED